MNEKKWDAIAFYSLWVFLSVFLVLEFIINLTPPISRDALIHHLAVPKLWLQHGGIYEMPWAAYSYYPMNIDLLYWASLYFKNDIAPKFIHFAFGLGTGILVYGYLKQQLNRTWGLLGLVIFLTTPIIIWLSTAAYIDLGMTFFTTGSIFAFLRWRDSGYQHIKWFFISSAGMGLAIGSKYSALIVMFFLNMMVIYHYARDTRRQFDGLKYGFFFFTIAFLVASPWYIKNYLLTANPVYPLYNGFFQSIAGNPVPDPVSNQIVDDYGTVSFFIKRKVLYGESFLKTLTIPIRMFFQGDDNSYQYFQGVLNPVLIIFSPFILLSKRYARDKCLFAFFAVFYILMTFHLTEQQVRYMVPALPFLTVLAVMGIKDVFDRFGSSTFVSSEKVYSKIRGCFKFIIVAGVIFFLFLNLLYLKNRIDIIKPFPLLFKQETRDQFLERHLPYYEAVKYINTHLPDHALIFTLFQGRRGYYLERPYRNEPSFGNQMIAQWVKNASSEENFKSYIQSSGITHILMRTDFVDNYLKDSFSIGEKDRFMDLVRKHWILLYHHNLYAVWDIRN